MKIAAIGDLHCQEHSKGRIRDLLDGIQGQADILLLAGDLTHRGEIREMEVLLQELKGLSLPIIAVVGNHDHEQNMAPLLVRMMEGSQICVLECSSCVIDGVGFVGTKGFCGGFGATRIQPFGEHAVKDFVQHAVENALQMEKAVVELQTTVKIGLLHYAPIKETLAGEPPELFPFLGTSLLADAFDRQRVDIIFHGHAHRGSPQGHTAGQIPVFNVARFVRSDNGLAPYMLYDTRKP